MRANLLAPLALAAMLASCGSSDLQQGGACNCRIEGDGFDARLLMSWQCYCATADCTRTIDTKCASHLQRLDYPGCGLSVLRVSPAGGPIDDVFDRDGKLIGVVIRSDTGLFECPSNPALFGYSMQAGQIPASTCASTTCGACTSTACGGSDDCQCRLESNVMTMTWDCFCSRFGGCTEPLTCSAATHERIDYASCGLSVVAGASLGVSSSVYDPSGALVGRTVVSDATPYTCPSNPMLTAQSVRAGQSPAASCAGASCGDCSTAPFPCAAALR